MSLHSRPATIINPAVMASCKSCSFNHFCHSPNLENCSSSHSTEKSVSLNKKLSKYSLYVGRGDKLCRAKEAFHSFYIVRSGALKIYEVGLEGKERILHFCLPGEIVGFEALHHNTYPYTVEALRETEVCKISFENLSQLLVNNPLLLRHMFSIVGQRIEMSAYMNIANAEQRLIAFFFEMSKRMQGENNKPHIILPMARQDIGNYLGLAAETVSRLLTRLRTRRLISVDRKQITLSDPEKLQRIVQGEHI